MAKRDKNQLANRVSTFVKKYARRARTGHDPNDRMYDRAIEKLANCAGVRRRSHEQWARLPIEPTS